MRILYLAHDLADPAITKRALMMQDGGATVTLAGFRRTEQTPETVAGCKSVDLGQTFNGGFIQRAGAVIKEIFLLKQHRALFADADVILARNLEMLAIAVRGRSLCSKKPIIVYECLDIHRLLLGKGMISKALRHLEGWLSKRASSLITSSPAFISGYFQALSEVRLPIKLVENKVYPVPAMIANPARPSGPIWKIGWFGVIRCRKSLAILTELVQRSQGAVEVIIRGRPALDQFDDFHKTVSTTPGLKFLGPYKNPDDLANIYREVHFNWAIDMFEEGLNSSWLLPNRLYEGGLYGAVPIALKNVETGHTLERMGMGITISPPYPAALTTFFTQLTSPSYEKLAASVTAQPDGTWAFTKKDCIDLVQYIGSYGH